MPNGFESIPIHPSIPEVRVGFTTTATGFEDAIPTWLVMPTQTHTANVSAVTPENVDDTFADTDGLLTSLPGIAVGVRTADCVPLMMYASDVKLRAAVHAGWKGTLARIAEVAVRKMMDFGADPVNIYARFGASICCDCYEVDRSLADKFTAAGFKDCIVEREGFRPHLDLVKVNTSQLIEIGVPSSHITKTTACTRHCKTADRQPRFHSWRRNPGTTLRNITFIYLERCQV